jgi:hypothetical protein
MASYYEICQLLKSNWTRVYNTEQKAPYICKGNQWIGFTFNFLFINYYMDIIYLNIKI